MDYSHWRIVFDRLAPNLSTPCPIMLTCYRENHLTRSASINPFGDAVRDFLNPGLRK
jgi:hypothetical protein